MPGGDRTGPQGAGARTGRGMGYCAGYQMPGSMYPGCRGGGRMRFYGGGRGFGFRRGLGFRRGRGMGFYNMCSTPYAASPQDWEGPAFVRPSKEDELGYLAELQKSLEQDLEDVRQRLKALSQTEEDK